MSHTSRLQTSRTTPDAFASASEYCARLIPVRWSEPRKFSARFYTDLAFNLGSPLPYAIQKYRSTAMKRAFLRECFERDYDLVVCDFLTPAINYIHSPARPAVLFQHNVESAIWRRHYETQTNRVKKAFFYNQWQKMYRYERDTCRAFNAVIAVSRADRDQMRDEFGVNEVYDVPTGVDTKYFRPLGNRPEPYNLVFTGSMDWIPNEDAIIYFAEKILPQISRRMPLVTLTVVGRNPSRRLKAIAEANKQIKITGRVDDVRPFIDSASAYVVPLRVGGGTRLKIYEAMAMGKPVISTTIGAEGLPVADGKELLIADEPEAFAGAAIRAAFRRAARGENRAAGAGDRLRASRVGARRKRLHERYARESSGSALECARRDDREAYMRLSIFGLGYVGCVSAACFTRDGRDVIGVDANQVKVDIINSGRSPIVEPGIEDLIKRGVESGRLRATTNAEQAVHSSDISLVCVGTPEQSQRQPRPQLRRARLSRR